jgi:hypothetical protein
MICRMPQRINAAVVKVFGCRPITERATGTGAGVEPPREETAGDGGERRASGSWFAARVQLWGFEFCGRGL